MKGDQQAGGPLRAGPAGPPSRPPRLEGMAGMWDQESGVTRGCQSQAARRCLADYKLGRVFGTQGGEALNIPTGAPLARGAAACGFSVCGSD